MIVGRLRTSRDVRAVLEEGTVKRGPLFVVRLKRNPDGPRLAVIASKRRVGKAHDRNRARRRIREAFRVANTLQADAVAIANPRALDAPFEALVSEVRRATR